MSDESIQKLEYVPCALCSSDDTELFLEDGCFNLVRCKRCGLVYVNPRPTRKELGRMYNMSVQTGNGVMDHTGYMELAYLHELKSNKYLSMIKKYEKEGRILDIGCASGFFLNFAKQRGFDPHGVDISKTLCVFAKRHFKLNISCGTLREISYPSEYFDVVTMFDVLSHLPTPVEDLNEVNRVLRKDGLLLIETGNRGELNAKAVEKWRGVWGSPSHLYHFGTKTLIKLLKITGFDCIDIDKSSVILSSVMEVALRRIIGSRKSKVSYQKIKLDAAPMIRRGLMGVGAHLYLLAKYGLGKLLPKSNVDCTLTVCCKKRRGARADVA
ncbi:MAG: methyltransferase domain-containing protein [Candidatus Hodarchaeota archaeon]